MNYHFDSFVLDTKNRQLLSSGEVVKIQPRVYQLLILLIKNRGNALDKNTIQTEIWPNQILSETSLSRLVMKARKALNDNPENPQYIKTLHGFGFQFIADITLEEESQEVTPSIDIRERNTRKEAKKSNFRLISFVSFCLIILALLVGIYFPANNTNSKPRILVLPVVNIAETDQTQWVSLGLPSLVNTLLEQTDLFSVVNTKEIRLDDFDYTKSPALDNTSISALKSKFVASQIVYTKLESQGNGYVLSMTINKNTTQTPVFKLRGEEPSQFARKIVNKIAHINGDDDLFYLDQAISTNDFVNTLYGKGRSLLIQGHTQKARDMFKAVIVEEPDLFWARYSYALTSRLLGMWEQSENELMLLLKHPNLAQITNGESKTRNVLGFTYFRLRQYEKALENYQIAFELSKADKEYRLQAGIADNLGALHWFNYQFDQARNWLNKAITIRQRLSINPTGHAYNLLGLLERDQGNLLAAKSQFSKSAKLFGEAGKIRDYTMVQLNLTSIDEHLGDYDTALSRLKESEENFKRLDEKQGLSFLHRQYAKIYIAMNDFNSAKEKIELSKKFAQELNSKPQIAEADFLLGQLRLKENDLVKAEPLLKSILPFYEEVWAPYVPLMNLAILKKDQQAFDQFSRSALKDASAKADNLYRLYVKIVQFIGQNKLGDKSDTVSREKLLDQARNLSAHKLLGLMLIEKIDDAVAKGNIKNAKIDYQELSLIHPKWQKVKSLSFYISALEEKSIDNVKDFEEFKANHLSTWSLQEERWLNASQNKLAKKTF